MSGAQYVSGRRLPRGEQPGRHFSWLATTGSRRRAMWSGVRTRVWAWNFAPPRVPKPRHSDQAAATARFRHDLNWPHNSLIDNQFPGLPQRGKRVCHRRNSRSLFAQVRALPAFFKVPAIVRPTTWDHDSVPIRLGTSRAGANQCHDGWVCFGRGLRSEF